MFSGTSNKVSVGLELVASQLSSNIIQLCSCWPVCYKEPQTAVIVQSSIDLKIHCLMCQYGIVHQHAHLPCLLQGMQEKTDLLLYQERRYSIAVVYINRGFRLFPCCKMDAILIDLYYLSVLQNSLVCHQFLSNVFIGQ